MAKANKPSANQSNTAANSDAPIPDMAQGLAYWTELQQQSAQSVWSFWQMSLQNQLAWQRQWYDLLTEQKSALPLNGLMQHTLATYSSIWNDPLGLTSQKS